MSPCSTPGTPLLQTPPRTDRIKCRRRKRGVTQLRPGKARTSLKQLQVFLTPERSGQCVPAPQLVKPNVTRTASPLSIDHRLQLCRNVRTLTRRISCHLLLNFTSPKRSQTYRHTCKRATDTVVVGDPCLPSDINPPCHFRVWRYVKGLD